MGANFDNALFFLVRTLFDLYLWVMILRVLLQWVRADFYNPISQIVWQATQYPVKPFAAVIPRWRRLDVAAVLLGYLIACVYVWIETEILNWRINSLQLMLTAALTLTVLTLKLYTFSIFVQAILSWLGPGTQNPAGSILWSLNEPLLRPLRRIIPPMGGLDLAPLVAMVGLLFLIRIIPLAQILR